MNLDLTTYYQNGLMKLPGVEKVKAREKLLADLLFFTVVVVIPSSFFALVDQSIVYRVGAFDLKLLFILSSFTYLIFYIGNLRYISQIPAGKALLILCAYIVFVIVYSRVRGIPGSEIIKVVRINYIYPVVCLSFLLYVVKLDNDRIFRLVRWICITGFLQGVLYLVSNLFGIEIFSASAKDPLEYKGAILYQNVFALPQFNAVIFCIAYLSSMMKGKLKYNLVWGCAVTIIVLSFVRNQIVVYLLYFLLLTLAVTIFINYVKIGRAFILGIIALGLSVIIIISFPLHAQKLLDKIGVGGNTVEIENVNVGTFDLRISAIKNSYDHITQNGRQLIGFGYVREARKGEYSLVLGGDTLVAPVLLTEGLLGLALRLLPIVILLFTNMSSLMRKREKKYHLYNILSISLIIPAMVNIIQTTLFTHYHQTMFILFVLEIIKLKNKYSSSYNNFQEDTVSSAITVGK